MARLARVVIPNIPHHLTQRGNRRQATFFRTKDYEFYLQTVHQKCMAFGVEIWAYCLMPNHVHFIAVPKIEMALAKTFGDAHQAYSRYINFQHQWRGYLWQGRFSSFPMDDRYLVAAARYIELNPVSAGLVSTPERWPWSSARSHLGLGMDPYVNASPILNCVENWKSFLDKRESNDTRDLIEQHERTGRPLGSNNFVKELESRTGRKLQLKKPGPSKLVAPEEKLKWPELQSSLEFGSSRMSPEPGNELKFTVLGLPGGGV